MTSRTLSSDIAARPVLRGSWSAATAAFAALTLTMGTAAAVLFALAVESWTPLAVVALGLFFASALWISGGAATAILGLISRPGTPAPPAGWLPAGSTAILITLCREDPGPVAAYLRGLRTALARTGLAPSTRIFVLSDTSGDAAVVAEDAAFGPLVADGAVEYRRRSANTGRKPGNIADWLERRGDSFDYMLVLDADSRMSAERILRMICRMEARPSLGLLQAGIALTRGRTRYARHQRRAARLLGPVFLRGFSAWTGRTGNYWGHNALVRVAAFRAAARLPVLSGPAPFGGALLSHDFVEAAWIRRAGWHVEIDVEQGGSAEDAPQTLAEFHRRDRRWCQGNLQHLRLLAEPGLHPLSRIHMASGIFSYLAAPTWLALVALGSSGAVVVGSMAPLVAVAILLLVPKVCGLAWHLKRRVTSRRLSVLLRASCAEFATSAILAPVMMLHQSASVLSVLSGRDCGWKSGRTPRDLPRGSVEALAGIGLTGLAVALGSASTVWLLPAIVSLAGAPVLIRYLEDAR
jgi:membrane glycosyltransferase